MLSKVSLRLKLSDFINTDIEEKVMNKVNHAHNEFNITVLLYLWFFYSLDLLWLFLLDHLLQPNL